MRRYSGNERLESDFISPFQMSVAVNMPHARTEKVRSHLEGEGVSKPESNDLTR